MPVAEVKAQQVAVRGLIERSVVASRAESNRATGALSSVRPVQVEPVTDRAGRYLKATADFGVGDSGPDESDGFPAQVRGMLVHIPSLRRGGN